MNVGSMTGVVNNSAAGAPLSQTKGSETERAQKDAMAAKRQADSDTKTEKASGVGATEGDEGVSERDADGRRLWERSQENEKSSGAADGSESQKKAKDITGNSGKSLDLTG